MAEFSRRLMMPTDVAHIVLFHPDDLSHAAGWPIAWYAEPFVYPVESAAGRLIAWCTKSDGGYAVRLTDGPMTAREQRYSGPSWVFPFTVRHGRIYLDNTDALPGERQRAKTSDHEDYWIEVANGDYAVTVTAIEWNAEPGSDSPDFEALPNYVVQFAPRGQQKIATANRPPDLECLMAMAASDAIETAAPRKRTTVDTTRIYPAFVSANVCRPGKSFSTQGEALLEAALAPDAERLALYRTDFVVASELAPGEPAVIANVLHSGGPVGEPKTYGLAARVAVRVRTLAGMVRQGANLKPGRTGLRRRRSRDLPQDALTAVMIEPIPDTADTTATPDGNALRERIVADLETGGPLGQRLGGKAGYEALRLRASDDAALIADWLIDHLPLDAAERLRLCILPPSTRLEAAASDYAQLRDAT